MWLCRSWSGIFEITTSREASRCLLRISLWIPQAYFSHPKTIRKLVTISLLKARFKHSGSAALRQRDVEFNIYAAGTRFKMTYGRAVKVFPAVKLNMERKT